MAKHDPDGLPHYSVVRGIFNAASDTSSRGHCPVCGKTGRWQGDTFVPTSERQAGYPPCYCATIHAGGGYAYDAASKQVLRRTGD
jgi:hypothetical protein